jgi:hypothetical protein
VRHTNFVRARCATLLRGGGDYKPGGTTYIERGYYMLVETVLHTALFTPGTPGFSRPLDLASLSTA